MSIAATVSTEQAFAACQRLATTHYENFSVLSWFLPRALRPHFSSVYAFCRHTDDLGDEDMVDMVDLAPREAQPQSQPRLKRAPQGGKPPPSLSEAPHRDEGGIRLSPRGASWLGEPPGARFRREGGVGAAERLARLDDWEADLRRCFIGAEAPEHPYLIALRETIRRFDLPAEPFLRLIEANRMDQRANRYPTYADVQRYCEHSANPVGRLVLMLYGYRDEERGRWSDAICTALQLTNFWQDVARDYHQRGRVYLPVEDMARFGYDEPALARGEATPAFRALMCFEVERARALFYAGLPLLEHLRGMPGRAVALFALGGLEILAAMERRDYDIFTRRPTLSSRRKLWLMARVALAQPGMTHV
ncbi:MAG TPA: squalene synthase HpnC [Ktedonobacterales bacterium]|nr:squalene synthase HpnC [Ktedonobacterales bacterium]